MYSSPLRSALVLIPLTSDPAKKSQQNEDTTRTNQEKSKIYLQVQSQRMQRLTVHRVDGLGTSFVVPYFRIKLPAFAVKQSENYSNNKNDSNG